MSDVVRCICGDPIKPENWALGPGWVHEHGSSQCRVFARPADPTAAAPVLAAFCKALRLPAPLVEDAPKGNRDV